MRIRSPSPPDREALAGIIERGGAFRPEEVSCAIELLDAALARADGNTYEALVVAAEAGDDDGDREGGERLLGYVCFGATPMTEATYDVYWIVVAAEARGRGLGRALIAATEQRLRERGAR